MLAALGLQVAAAAVPAEAAELISINIHGVSGDASSNGVAVSTDGSVVAFYSDADDLVSNDANQARDVFVRDRNNVTPELGTTELVSVSSAGVKANGPSQSRGMPPAISDDGKTVAFYSDASNLVSNDNNGTTDVFVRDRRMGVTKLVSSNLSGVAANGPSLFPSISADGRFVAFQSAATDLVPGDTNGVTDIFVRDLQAGTTERACHLGEQGFGPQPNAASYSPAISGDGNFVAFVSAATNLVPHDTNGKIDVFECNRNTGEIRLVSVDDLGVQGNGNSITPAINFNGDFVAFKSDADNLVPNDLNGLVDVFLHDRSKGTTERISVSATGGNSNEVSFPPSISDDGRFVAFGSYATNLVPNDANGVADVFVRDRLTGVTLLADLGPNGQQANGGTPDVAPALSGNGREIGFVSSAANLGPKDLNQLPDVLVNPNPFFCPDGICPGGLVCVSGICAPLAASPTATSKTPPITATPTPTPTPTLTSTPTNTPTPIACIGIEDCPSGQVCFQGFCVNPTPTATPLPCTDSSQCPSGEVCRDHICQPALSPTPTMTPTPIPTCTTDAQCAIACSSASDCHSSQDCVSGHCSPADRCVDGVCAPTRLCESENPVTCIATRETCLNGTCECGGDCNLDGFVFADEVAKMICILSNHCQITECEAGDFDRSGDISGNEVCQAVTNLGIGCPLGIQNTLQIADPANGMPRSLTVVPPPGSVSPGQIIPIRIDLGGAEGITDVATAQLDMLFDTSVLSLTDQNTACTVDPPLNATDASFSFMPRRPDTPANVDRLRLFVANLGVCNPNEPITTTPFGAGPMLTCGFRINPTASPGETTITGERTNLGDIQGNEIPSNGSSATITIVQQPCTQTADCPSGLLCRDGLCQPECSTDAQCTGGDVCRTGICVPPCTQDSDCTGGKVCRNDFCVPTCTQDGDCSNGLICRDGACVPPCTTTSDCPLGSTCVNGGCTTGQCTVGTDCPARPRQGCVNNLCVCAGDCDGDGIIRNNEVIKMLNIFTGAAPVTDCPSVDINGDGIIRNNEVISVLTNFTEGCPH